MYAVLGTVPAEGRDRLLYGLLKANLFGAATSGATLAIDSEREEFVLFRTVGLEGIELSRLLFLLEKFVDTTEFWSEKIDRKLTVLHREGKRSVHQAIAAGCFIRA